MNEERSSSACQPESLRHGYVVLVSIYCRIVVFCIVFTVSRTLYYNHLPLNADCQCQLPNQHQLDHCLIACYYG